MKIVGVFLAIYSVLFAQESQDFVEKIFSQADINGWGIKGSAQANWIIGWGFEIFGRTSLSGLVGDVIFRQTENFVDGNAAGTQTFFGSTHKETRWKKLLYNLEVATGINWGRRFCRNKFYFGLQFGYEFTLWPEFIRMNRYAYGNFPNTDGFSANALGPVFAAFRNNLALHGITLSGRVFNSCVKYIQI